MRLFCGARLPLARAIALNGSARTAQARSARPLGAPAVGTALRFKPRGL